MPNIFLSTISPNEDIHWSIMNRKLRVVLLPTNSIYCYKGSSLMVDQMWGLFLYSVVSGIGFDVSHSISDLNRSYLTKNACVEAAKSLNKKPNRDKQIGLDNGVSIRYVCLLKPSNDPTT